MIFRVVISPILVWLLWGCGNFSIRPNEKSDDKIAQKGEKKFYFEEGEQVDAISLFEAINDLVERSDNIEDSLELAQSYLLISLKLRMSRDFEKAEEYNKKARLIFLHEEDWKGYFRAGKAIAVIYRRVGKLHLIEDLLKKDLELIVNKKIKTFSILYPIHELTIHYSYDLGCYKEAVELGEYYLDRLAYYDSLNIQDELFLNIKKYEKDIVHLELGVSYTKLGDRKNALKHLTIALNYYSKAEDNEKLIRVNKGLIDYYALVGNMDKLVYHKNEFYERTKANNLKLVESEKGINKLILKSVEDDRKLEVLREENKLKSFLILVGIFGILALVFFQWYMNKLRKDKREVAIKLEKQKEFNNFKTNLFITVAHEIRTPLTVILGYLQLISDKNIQPDKFKKYFEQIKNNSQGILNRISSIIDLVKEDKTKTRVVLQEVRILPFLQGLFFGFEGMAKIKKIQLCFNAELHPNQILKTDPKILDGLLSNLIHNAIKFSNSNSEVKMLVSYRDKNLIIHVVDQGVGISKSNHDTIFDMFNRISTGTIIDGFGIGLAIVKYSTEQLKGKITVKSNIGKGSTFTLILPDEMPLATVEERTSIWLKTEETDKPNGGMESNALSKILIVEDNPQMCSFYKHIFSSFFECTFVFNGLEGFNMLKDSTFDIILSDIMMPEMGGMELKEKVRTMPNREKIPFILVTAKDQDESKIEAFNIGVDDYIVKPFNKDELIARIKALIANQKARERWALMNNEETTSEKSAFDIKTVRKLQEIILLNCANENFGVLDLAKEIGLSQRQMVRVVKKLTGLTPVKFILEVRLLEAYKKIKNKEEADINNVRFSVGIQSTSYFSTQFKKRFGLNPTELVKYRKNELINLEEDYTSS